MENLVVLRIYYRYNQRSKNLTFWQKLWNPNLGQRLLQNAEAQNIYQANIFMAKSGYLERENISYDISDAPPPKNTVCLELLDTEENLRTFLKVNKEDLEEAIKILLFPKIELIK